MNYHIYKLSVLDMVKYMLGKYGGVIQVCSENELDEAIENIMQNVREKIIQESNVCFLHIFQMFILKVL